MQDLDYKEKFRQIDKEAKATFIVALIIFAYFWLSIFLFKDQLILVLNMPLWFVLSCIGGYLLSVVLVIALVKFCMKNFSLD